MRPTRFFIAFFICCFVSGAAVCRGANDPAPDTPSARTAQSRYLFGSVLEGKEILHDFIIENKGTADLKIEKVRTD